VTEQATQRKIITYYVNGEAQTTTQDKLTVRAILTAAGFTPAEEYRLTRDEGHHVYHDYSEEVPLHESEKFTATFLGPTPTS
jgi:hypothetical protein